MYNQSYFTLNIKQLPKNSGVYIVILELRLTKKLTTIWIWIYTIWSGVLLLQNFTAINSSTLLDMKGEEFGDSESVKQIYASGLWNMNHESRN